MSAPVSYVEIPARLEEPGRFFIFEMDELAAIALPILFGVIANSLIPGVLVGVGAYVLWVKIKSVKGFYGLHAMRYWHLPQGVTRLDGLPNSAVTRWFA